MPHPNSAARPIDFALHLLQSSPEASEPIAHLSRLDPAALDYLRAKASDLHHRAVGEARDLLDIALESLEFPLPAEHQRRLLERVDEQLTSAQRWGELAANARFCLERQELARQLAGEVQLESANPVADASGSGTAEIRERARTRSAK
ncbi:MULTISPECIES: hypothetical protein [unclassified Lysobacter]|uniref:hypothetical protein n=1 Tax=unclassified Lysobacter TaxID=2635362 RepID=UPI001BED0065|nr:MULTISPECIES: hypothetical protein [unclassified Lysobacter]MBT2749296.1 hypothetical protein [Lysobacter sp. ISL-42]MBT2754321.1 hypothetical protein [Lysobacter sp. ISL-50]MBT2777193.1 hypothetical protein [Lysobacter sp. ISL-54]MBT2780182.1 hypothetical protein [Lysobacter sp. ISL-52]